MTYKKDAVEMNSSIEKETNEYILVPLVWVILCLVQSSREKKVQLTVQKYMKQKLKFNPTGVM